MFLKPLVIIGGLALASVLYVDVAGEKFGQRIKQEERRIVESVSEAKPPKVVFKSLSGLPEPVEKYFRYALRDGQDRVRHAGLRQSGEFRTGETSRWIPFEAEQHYAVASSSFLWRAKFEVSPYIWTEARDLFYGGKADTVNKLFSAFTLSFTSGKETDLSSLVRFLTEAPWFPTALLPSEHLAWETIDSHTARAVMNGYGYHVAAVFTFNEKGEIVKVTTGDRYRNINGESRKETWSARYSDYRDMDGMKIPTDVEAEWTMEERGFPYAKFRVTEVRYDGR